VFSLIALNAEHVYVLLLTGVLFAILVFVFWNWRMKKELFHGLGQIIATLILSLAIVLFQGGVITILFRNLFPGNLADSMKGLGTAGFFFQWPPALIADYFQPLSIFNPAQVIVGLAEMGPTILLLPIVVNWIWKFGKRGHLIEAGLGLSGLFGFILPFFIHYSVERDTSRITSFGLQIFLIVSVPALALLLKQGKARLRGLIIGGFGITIASGIVIIAILYTSITTPQITYFIDPQDARMSSLGWNQIKPGSWVLDRIPYRAVTIYGHPSRSSPASGPVDFSTYPEWEALIENPNPGDVATAGYGYIYMDNTWWNQLTLEQQSALNQNCVQVAQEMSDETSENWRRLLDVSQCK
jgi:hypothetical protein